MHLTLYPYKPDPISVYIRGQPAAPYLDLVGHVAQVLHHNFRPLVLVPPPYLKLAVVVCPLAGPD